MIGTTTTVLEPQVKSKTEEIASDIKGLNCDIQDLLKAIGCDLDVLKELQQTHKELWDFEDQARSHLATAERVADVKKNIDRLNGHRHKLIEKFDNAFYQTPPAQATVYYSETPGELCDRLLILHLKISNAIILQNSADLSAESRAECIKKIKKLGRWIEHLQLTLRKTLNDFEQGWALLPPRSEFKMYNEPELNPVVREELAIGKNTNGGNARKKVKNVNHVLSIACTGHGASLTYIGKNGEVRSSVFDRWIGTKHTLLFAKDELKDILTQRSDVDKNIFDILRASYGRFPNHQVFEDHIMDWFEWLVKGLDVTAEDIDLLVLSESHFATSFFRLGPRMKEWFPNVYIRGDVEHHSIHQRQAFWQSGFEAAAVLTLDTCGEQLERLGGGQLSGSISKMDRSGNCEVIKEFFFPMSSIGMLYALTNHHIGFRQGQEGKTMGLAPYGNDEFYLRIKRHLELFKDGSFRFMLIDQYLDELKDYVPIRPNSREAPLTEKHENVAYGIQALLQDVLTNAMEAAMRLTGLKTVVYAGGVALNSVANEIAIRATKPERIYIAPNPSDTGQSLGAALIGSHEIGEWKPSSSELGDYLGPEYSRAEIDEAVKASDYHKAYPEDVLGDIAQCLANGYIVGRFTGRAEFGPRALGNRSILADPRREDMKDYLNSRVKHREGFRPFAPSVLEEHVSDWFDLNERSPYMLRVVPVLEEVRERIPAIVHVDGSARVQTVSQTDNESYWTLISRFKEITGVPVVVNTSFNVAGKPIVETPEHAIECFENTDIDLLCFDHCILSKKPLNELLNQPR